MPAFERPFVGVDGEARGDRYVLLAASTGAYVEDSRGLPTIDSLEFLLSLAGPRILVGFGWDYDANMILGDLPLRGERHSIQDLYVNGWTYWRGYRIRYIPRKLFGVSHRETGRSVTVFDVWSFFASSFIRALGDHGIKVPPIIRQGKAARAKFSSWSLKRIREYNAEECRLLVELCDKLREAIRPLGLRVSSWHGPGAVAGAWLARERAHTYLKVKGTERFETVARSAYFGGRVDVAGWGVVSPAYHYDIRSAYPAAALGLPDLRELRWRRTWFPDPSRLSLVRVRWDLQDLESRWGPFPWRSRDGSILWPLEGEGWYWSPEVIAAVGRFGDRIMVEESYQVAGRLTYPLAGAIEETYRERERLKRVGDPSEYALKLVLNSLYGKFAQSVGTARYHSWIWAGLITATTRARISDLIEAAGDENTAMVMTDGIWTSRALPRSMLSPGLGGLERGSERKLWVLEPGVYATEDGHGKRRTYHRGMESPPDVPAIVEWWRRGMPARRAPRVVFGPTRFIGAGCALVIDGVYRWRTWTKVSRRIEPVPVVGTGKRLPYSSDGGPYAPFEPMYPAGRSEPVISYPYEPRTLDPEILRRRMEDEATEEVET